MARMMKKCQLTNGTYSCQRCNVSFSCRRSCEMHLLRKHRYSFFKGFECPYCQKLFSNMSYLRAHINLLHKWARSKLFWFYCFYLFLKFGIFKNIYQLIVFKALDGFFISKLYLNVFNIVIWFNEFFYIKKYAIKKENLVLWFTDHK